MNAGALFVLVPTKDFETLAKCYVSGGKKLPPAVLLQKTQTLLNRYNVVRLTSPPPPPSDQPASAAPAPSENASQTAQETAPSVAL